MKKGYSRILINEWCLDDRHATLFATLSDINMMAVCAGMERSDSQWHELLESTGFKIIRIWTVAHDSESLIEAVLED